MLGKEPFAPDFVIIDGADFFGFKNENEFMAYVQHYADSGKYEVEAIKDRYFVLSLQSQK